MDEVLPRVMLESIQIFLVIIGILIIVMIMNYWMVIPIAILVILFYFVRISYLRTANGVKRLEGVGKYAVARKRFKRNDFFFFFIIDKN